MNDESIPEEDRIYTKSRKLWCKKTTKESADKLFKSLEELKETMKTRGCNPIVPPKEDWVVDLGIYTYEYDPEDGEYKVKSYTMEYYNKIKHLFYADSSDYE